MLVGTVAKRIYFVFLYIISSVSSYCIYCRMRDLEVKDNNDITMAADVKKLNNFLRILYLQNAR